MAWSIFTDGGGDSVAAGWAQSLLQMMGAPVTAGNEQFIYDWEKSEGGGGKYNPLNQGPVPGHPELTTTGSQYGGGAADFASWQAGLQGAVDYLNMSNYTQVKADIMANNPVGARQALIDSPWAASHYGYGSSFSNAALPNQVSALPQVSSGSGVSPAASTTSLGGSATNPLQWLLGLFGGGSTGVSQSSAVDLIERFGLILLGGAFILIGVFRFTDVGRSAGKNITRVVMPAAAGAAAARRVGLHESNKSIEETENAVES